MNNFIKLCVIIICSLFITGCAGVGAGKKCTLVPDSINVSFGQARYREEDADIVIGSRMHEKERIPRYRYIPNQVGVKCISWAAGCHMEDTQSGYRLYNRKVIQAIKPTTKGYHTETEILIKAGKKGFKIVTIPIKPIYFPLGQETSYYRPIIDTYLICITFLKSFFW